MRQTRIVLMVLVVIAVLIAVAKFRQSPNNRGSNESGTEPPTQPTIPVSFVTPELEGESGQPRFVMVALDNQEFSVEVARTEEEITQGLSNRTALGSDGMLFVIDPPRVPSFWMKGMSFPLDLIWIRNGKVVKIDHSVPVPGINQDSSSLPRYQPPSVVEFVLELPAGIAKTLGFKVGSTFSLLTRY